MFLVISGKRLFLTSSNHIFKGILLLSCQNLVIFALTLSSAPYFFTVFMVLWLPKVKFVSVLIAEFTTFMFNLEGFHLIYVFTVRLIVKIHWHKRSF